MVFDERFWSSEIFFRIIVGYTQYIKFRFVSTKHTLDTVSKTSLLGSKPAEFPKEQNHMLSLANMNLLTDPVKYQRLIGCLIYLYVMCPKLSCYVHILSQLFQKRTH